jgi:hypothetical protein
MKHRQGPTKKLIPSLSPENRCPHEYSEDEGLQLEIDCSACQGAQDLTNSRCISGILNVMVTGAVPTAIILKRLIHKRYRGEAIGPVALVASELSALNRAIASAEKPSDKRCRTCSASRERVLTAMKHRLLENPAEYLPDHKNMAAELTSMFRSDQCGDSVKCIENALSTSIVQSEVV